MTPLRAILFAGGVGQRLWPLSRRNTPKQFVALTGSKSSFQLAVERLASIVPADHMYIATNQRYGAALREQAPAVPAANFFLEPARRDVAAAVALAFFSLEKDGASGPALFQWTDNYVKNPAQLMAVIEAARAVIETDPDRLVFLGERPRFANENLGWIELGETLGSAAGMTYYNFRRLVYRPPKAVAEQMFASGNYVWNSGYFLTSIGFMTSAFRKLAPELAKAIKEIVAHRGTELGGAKLNELYPAVPALHFDEAILERLGDKQAILLQADLGWSDPGSLYSLKETLQEAPEASVSQGNVVELGNKDCLIYNDSSNKLVAAMGLEGIIVVDTPDVTLVIHKDSVRDLGKLLEQLGAKGLDRLL